MGGTAAVLLLQPSMYVGRADADFPAVTPARHMALLAAASCCCRRGRIERTRLHHGRCIPYNGHMVQLAAARATSPGMGLAVAAARERITRSLPESLEPHMPWWFYAERFVSMVQLCRRLSLAYGTASLR